MIMVWWIQLSRIIHPAVSPLWIYCVSGDGRCWWILFSRGSPGSKQGEGELYSMLVGGSLSLVEGSLGSDGCYGREWWPGSMPGEEGGTAAATRTGTTHNAQLHILRTRQNTAAHREQHTQFGGGSVAAAVHQLAAYMSDQTRRQLTNIGEDKHTSSKTLSADQYARGCTHS